DQVEHRALGYRGDPPAHLRVHDDPDDPDHDDPQQLEPERRPGLGVEHQIPDVDEATDGGQDAEGDREDLPQAHPSSTAIRSIARAAAWRSRARPLRSPGEARPRRTRSVLTRPATAASRRSRGSRARAVVAALNVAEEADAASER